MTVKNDTASYLLEDTAWWVFGNQQMQQARAYRMKASDGQGTTDGHCRENSCQGLETGAGGVTGKGWWQWGWLRIELKVVQSEIIYINHY